MATINYKENGEWKELAIGGGGGNITVDDAISLTSENPVQNKVITDALDGLVYDYDLLTITGEQLDDIFNIITSNPMKSKSIICRWGNGMAKVEAVEVEGVGGLIAYVGTKKYLFTALLGTNGWCEAPWVFTPDGNNWGPMLGMTNMSSLCNEARIEINGKLHPVVYYEGNASDATLYAVVEDKLNKYVVHGELLADPALMTLESSTPIGGSIAVDEALSLTSENPVQNKVITKELSDKVNLRFIYAGETQEERDYNLETLRLLDEGFAAEMYFKEAELIMPCISYELTDNQWRFVVAFGATTPLYVYFDEDGVRQANLNDLLREVLSVNKNCDTEHVKRVISYYSNIEISHMEFYTIAKTLPHSDGALYITWSCDFDSDGKPLRVYADYTRYGLNEVDVYDVNGSRLGSVTFPLIFNINGTNNDYASFKSLCDIHMLRGEFTITDNNNSNFTAYRPISAEFIYENNTQYWLITIFKNSEFVTYRLGPDGILTKITN
jgi:hypothetical protein